jgi:hypothetical protein
MLTYDIDDWHLRSACIVQIGKTVPEAGAKVQQRAGWLSRHSRIAVRGTSHNAFEKTQHAPYSRGSIECFN